LFLGHAPLPDPIAEQFRLSDTREVRRKFTIARYRAEHPVVVTKAQLIPPGLLRDSLAFVPES
jgi:hypothetical protein